MKNVFIATLLILAAGPVSAWANPTGCTENVDHGYSVRFSADLNSAEVTLTDFADSKVVANLRCYRESMAPPSEPGIVFNLLGCGEPQLMDAGYSLVVQQNSTDGATTATLSEVTFFGSNPLAELNCR